VTGSAGEFASRPPKPRASLILPFGVLLFLGLTWVSISKELGIGLDLGKIFGSLDRGASILADLAQPNWRFASQTVEPMLETFRMAVVAAAIGCSIALPVAFLASRVTAPNRAVFFADRGILSVVRAIPDFLYALIFVSAAGLGPLPGIAALILFNIGVVAKLQSETVDSVDVGPIEAARAGGASRLQTIRWAVLPQVLPNYVAYCLYTFELNIRASTVLGIVGAGGIGRLLLREYKFFNWSNVSVIVIELFLFVFVIELISIALRRRLV
jgi:phosphonate transport system permease protein